MAIAPTGNIFKALSFDNVSSRSYGVYITGEAVFNAPERDVEMITIPARNGLFALDQGRFENIEVTYPAGIFADTEADFAQAISDFRNFLCSKKGYCRLTDDYNPNEYRMAIYKSGLDVKLAQLKAGEFNITFDCKPQRFLTSGETAVAVTSGNTITNPTLFDASPMLEVKGYGNIQMGSDTITLASIPLGEIPISAAVQGTNTATATLDVANLISGDSIYSTQKIKVKALIHMASGYQTGSITVGAGTIGYVENQTGSSATLVVEFPFNSAVYGTSSYTTQSGDFNVSGANSTVTVQARIDYNSGTNKLLLSVTALNPSQQILVTNYKAYIPQYYAYSTKNASGNPVYIDLDIGEAWNEDSGSPVSINNALTLPAKLPVLESGTTTITFDNTITSLKVRPRWWKI